MNEIRILVVFAFQGEIEWPLTEKGIYPRMFSHVLLPRPRCGILPTTSKALAVQENECSYRRPARKRGLHQTLAHHDHVAPLCGIHFIQPAPRIERKVADLVQLRLDTAHDFNAGRGEFADLMDVAPGNDGRSGAHVPGLGADICVVLIHR